MPIYEYRCADCHQIFEEWCKRIADTDEGHACPICNGPAHRLISQTSFALKGEGWYVTEYGSKKNISEQTADAPVPAPSVPGASSPAPAAGAPAPVAGTPAVAAKSSAPSAPVAPAPVAAASRGPVAATAS